ncbi:isoleucine--tRNA ligase [Myxococcota bacterium]|nr:isoleucine--tRNA ligase [Myxococcota bacterium]
MTQEDTKDKDPYKKTLNLPQTRFAMRANLVQNEPQFQKRWDKIEIFSRIRNQHSPNGPFVFHDGPPYANGSIHLGHLLNKVLKDLVVRSRSMAGFEVNFVPGWDCHGLPIEHKVVQELGDKAREMVPLQIRGRCKTYAEKFIKVQAQQMQRLGTLGDYNHPYITMDPTYEGAVLEVFADLVQEGLVYRALKPVHWSVANQTALAEAELEYEDRQDISIYVLFAITDPHALPSELHAPTDTPVHLMIWTTTPWTLPANLAVAVAANEQYGLYRFTQNGQTRCAVIGSALHETVLQKGGATDISCLGTVQGSALVDAKLRYQHPFVDRTSPVVSADYVTLTDGTGLVHTAPGHGAEDYQTGLREGLDIYCPVRADGTYDESVPSWLQGKDIWKANSGIVEHLRESHALFHDHLFWHSYPHDWRSKTPTIFRATDQWFIGVDRVAQSKQKTLRELALEAAKETIQFVPEWGENRLRGMLEARPDWCISRQRAWGLPIPAFYNAHDELLLTAESVRAVARTLRQKGSDFWFKANSADLLGDYDPNQDPQAPLWAKQGGKSALSALRLSNDIFDVWFESGSSWNAVLRERNIGYPADLYLEGSDQHRGWFQLSLLPALGATGQSPFKTVLTHGFMVDAKGRKMSKSEGNTIEVEDLLKEHGADVCRWWVSSLNYANDIKVDQKFFHVASEEYRKIRNTIRFLLANLYDFDPNTDRYTLTSEDRHSIDFWAHNELQKLTHEILSAYQELQFKRVREALFLFANDTMSAIYMAATKDRLYCEKPSSPKRRRTQTVMYDTAVAMIQLSAPILVHTAEEAWLSLHNLDPKDSDASVHLTHFPTAQPVDHALSNDWQALMDLREKILKALEEAKETPGISFAMDAGIQATVPAELYAQISPYAPEMPDLCNVSRFALHIGPQIHIQVDDLRQEPRCARSWKRDGTVQTRGEDGAPLSLRDAQVLGLL